MDHVHICQDGDGRGAGRRGPGCRVVSAVGSRRVEPGECKEEMQPTIGDRRCEVIEGIALRRHRRLVLVQGSHEEAETAVDEEGSVVSTSSEGVFSRRSEN